MKNESTNERLKWALKALAAETAQAGPSARVKEALLRRVRATRSPFRRWRWPVAAGMAAAAAFAVWSVSSRGGHVARQVPLIGKASIASTTAPLPAVEVAPAREAAAPAESRQSAVRRARAVEPAAGLEPQPFTPWFFNTGLPLTGAGHVVRVTVSPEVAARFGVYTTGDGVQAQIFLGDDGMTRAIRFVR
jgi:hypothetical protein